MTLLAILWLVCSPGEICQTLGTVDSFCGDANEDGVLTIADRDTIVDCALELVPCDPARADVTGDGLVTALDARRVHQVVAAVRPPSDLICQP